MSKGDTVFTLVLITSLGNEYPSGTEVEVLAVCPNDQVIVRRLDAPEGFVVMLHESQMSKVQRWS